jgi:hypothetical protein
VVFIGIGNFDFDNIDDLKKTNFIVKNSFGEKSKRNLVQFVNFNQFDGDVNYYKFKNINR